LLTPKEVMIFQLGYSKNEKTRFISEKMSGLKVMLYKHLKDKNIIFSSSLRWHHPDQVQRV
jgi:hypothetical protein